MSRKFVCLEVGVLERFATSLQIVWMVFVFLTWAILFAREAASMNVLQDLAVAFCHQEDAISISCVFLILETSVCLV
jgi:hypothetical protein